ncbi:SAM-dependent methyltransferase [Methanocalculus sp. AMF5]|uniref:class I SAM-dependent methyltransferase n=1 Tax=Methanocalculus sp. AMF5 TaxID=1198257 RepID=UPI00209FC0BF|nr:class I SAM-dependent methyltransferase [Methanocalculus sp. AMF5]MCP1663168.1 SAM-dependent methyltransferase [Methanocalculus sp. AMF5]
MNIKEISDDYQPRMCSICGSDLDEILVTYTSPDRFEHAIGITNEGYRRYWIKCSLCGCAINVMKTHNRSLLSKLEDNYYNVDFASANTNIQEKYSKIMSLPESQSDNAGRVRRIVKYLSIFRDVIKSYDSPVNVLDIGAGMGVFLSKLNQIRLHNGEEWALTAIEPDPIAAEHLRKIKIMKVIEGIFNADARQKINDQYDLLTVNKVLEHLENPVNVLSSAADILSKHKGLLYIELPDILSIGRRHEEVDVVLHHHLYSPISVVKLIESANLVPLTINRIKEPSGKITIYCFACHREAVDEKMKFVT